MKFRTYGMVLGLFFALGLVFSFTIEASGTHGDSTITAQEVADDPGNETKMKEFVNRIVNYYEHVRADNIDNRPALIRELTIFARDLRREGDYKHGDIYAMGITENLVVTNHAEYPELIGHKVNPDAGTPLADTFKALLDGSAIGDTNCATYGQDGRVACAAKVESDLTVNVTNIAGLRHEVDDAAFVEPDCSGLTLDTSAMDVYGNPSDANLEAYVKGVIETVQEDVAKITAEQLTLLAGTSINELLGLANDAAKQQEITNSITTRIQERLFCFGSGDFKYENIYVFIMSEDLEQSTVIVNGNNFDLNGGNLELRDNNLEGEDKTIAGLFNRVLAGGTSAYADYRWDDPKDDTDEVENWFENNLVPGTSPKRSYIEVADLNGLVAGALAQALGLPETTVAGFASQFFPPQNYIFGSGVYPDVPNVPDMMDDMAAGDGDDSGCAIAGAGHTSRSTLLNLFLVAFVLFPAVFLKRRA